MPTREQQMLVLDSLSQHLMRNQIFWVQGKYCHKAVIDWGIWQVNKNMLLLCFCVSAIYLHVYIHSMTCIYTLNIHAYMYGMNWWEESSGGAIIGLFMPICDPLSENPALCANTEFEIEAILLDHHWTVHAHFIFNIFTGGVTKW